MDEEPPLSNTPESILSNIAISFAADVDDFAAVPRSPTEFSFEACRLLVDHCVLLHHLEETVEVPPTIAGDRRRTMHYEAARAFLLLHSPMTREDVRHLLNLSARGGNAESLSAALEESGNAHLRERYRAWLSTSETEQDWYQHSATLTSMAARALCAALDGLTIDDE